MNDDEYDLWIQKAIGFCAQRFKKSKTETVRMLQEGNCYVHSTLRYAIAKEISAYLKDHVDGIKGVYLYGSTATNEARPCSDIDMLVHIDTDQKKVEEVTEKLERGVLRAYLKVLQDDIPLVLPLLDFHIIDTESIKKREGYAALVTSLSSPPLKI